MVVVRGSDCQGASVQIGQHLIINREPDFQLNIVDHSSQHQMS